ncbi:MAG: nitronate monooxygenase family protein [Dehalococcoidia bacterium]|jgi:nitronate monooxygenase|nr:nitronate monooxygenase family protein [Dehalococcoidia bacterium]
MFQNRITEMFGIRYPIFKGGLQHLSRAELVAAVANAGGLGFITAGTFPTKEELRQEIRKCKDLTDKPIGVNITLFTHPRATVTIEDYIECVAEEGITAVETAGRSPEPYMNMFKDAGIKVLHKTTAVRFAKTAERVGVDAITILGFEAAGHPGREDVTSLILTPLAADGLSVPVVAAGGFGDARGFVAALALGAEGVLMGTRFVATQECPAHAALKEAVLKAQEIETVVIERSVGNPMRALRNPTAETVMEMEARGTNEDELYPFLRGDLGRKAYLEGETDKGIISVGEVVGLVRDVPTVKQVIDGIVEGAQTIVERLHTLGSPVPGGSAR